MHPLSEHARLIIDKMDPDRTYGPEDLQGMVPDASVERVREIMHELWVGRQVERVGYSGWRRARSAPPHRSESASVPAPSVTPDELFDHDAFADFFK